MSDRTSPRASLIFALVAAGLLLTVGGWRQALGPSTPVTIAVEGWQQAQQTYPLPGSAAEPPELSQEMVDAVRQANPFSDRRAQAPALDASSASGTLASQAPPPQFLYKGRVALGQRQRAILEETTSRKTYFLEVGQAVAGFKVLDIAENRVVLSDPSTSKEVVVSLAASALPRR